MFVPETVGGEERQLSRVVPTLVTVAWTMCLAGIVWAEPRPIAKALQEAGTSTCLLKPCEGCSEAIKSCPACVLCSILKVEAAVEAVKANAEGFRLEAGGGLEIDDVSGGDATKIDLGMSGSAGGYPTEYSGSWKARNKRTPSASDEQVTEAKLSVDHYLLDGRVEGYVFVERFSDSFMSIDQRWEIGLGGELELRSDPYRPWRSERHGGREGKIVDRETFIRRYTEVGQDLLGHLHDLLSLGVVAIVEDGRVYRFEVVDREELLQELTDKSEPCVAESKRLWRDTCVLERELARDVVKKFASLLEDIHRARRLEALSQQRSSWEGGFGLSIIQELEDVELKVKEQSTMEDRTFRSGDSISRASLRASLRYRPSDRTSVRLLVYYKPRVGGEEGFGSDYRLEGQGTLAVELPGAIGKGTPSLNMEYRYSHDSRPPRLEEIEPLAKPTDFDRSMAEDTHQYVSLTLKLKWK